MVRLQSGDPGRLGDDGLFGPHPRVMLVQGQGAGSQQGDGKQGQAGDPADRTGDKGE